MYQATMITPKPTSQDASEGRLTGQNDMPQSVGIAGRTHEGQKEYRIFAWTVPAHALAAEGFGVALFHKNIGTAQTADQGRIFGRPTAIGSLPGSAYTV